MRRGLAYIIYIHVIPVNDSTDARFDARFTDKTRQRLNHLYKIYHQIHDYFAGTKRGTVLLF